MEKQTRRRLWILGAVFGVFVLVGAGGYLGRQWQIVQQRKAMIATAHDIYLFPGPKWRWPFLIRHWMGDKEVSVIFVGPPVADEQFADYQASFPEAQVIRAVPTPPPPSRAK